MHLTSSISGKTASLFAKTFTLLFVPYCLLKTASLSIDETLVWTQVNLTLFTGLCCFVVHVSNEAFCLAKLQTDSIVLIVYAFIERFNTACISLRFTLGVSVDVRRFRQSNRDQGLRDKKN